MGFFLSCLWQDGNNFRREWDKEAFEKRAKERLENELLLEDEREHKKTEPRAIVQRAPLMRRTEDLQIAKFVGTRQVITGAEALAGAGAYFCKVCECHLRDSQNYLAHINGKKHNRMLGMSMRAERSTLGEVRARLEAHKERDAGTSELSADEKAAAYLEQFEERMRVREEEAKLEAAEKRRLKRQGAGGADAIDADDGEGDAVASAPTGGGGSGVLQGGAAAVADEEEEYVADEPDQDFAAMMGFGGFSSTKNPRQGQDRR